MSRLKWARGRVDRAAMDRLALLVPLAVGFGLAVAGPVGAEMYRCTGPDGSEIFTSDAAACPGAQRHRPSRDVQRVPSEPQDGAAPAPGAPAPRLREPAASEDGQAAMWKRKRVDAESERGRLRRQHSELKEVVTWCNRGGELVLEDELGVRQQYDCADAQESYDRAAQRLAELDQYLAEGLAEECRRAGCLPGWIR